MALYSLQQKWVGLAKETTRGTAVAPSKFIPVEMGSEADYKLNLIEDELARGIFEKYPPKEGTKEGTFSLAGIEVQSDNIGEFLNSLLGSVTTTDVGGTGQAYQHSFKRSSGIIMPSYTLTIHRGINAKQYPLSVVKSIALNQSVDGKLKANITGLFKTESDYATPPTPSWTDPTPFMFFQNDFKIDGVSNTKVREWSITIDNGSIGLRALNGSQDIFDIISHAKLLVSGSFSVFFEDETQRQKFLSNTSASIEITSTGALIESGYNHQLKIKLPQVHYTAYPFGNIDGLLGASVSFNAYYNQTATNSVEVILINTITGY